VCVCLCVEGSISLVISDHPHLSGSSQTGSMQQQLICSGRLP